MTQEKILIVEDNPQNMRLMEMTLSTKDYTLLKAVNGEEALDIVTKERPDLIIMDMQLPKMGGLEVTRRLRQMTALSCVPILALSAYAMKGDKEKFIEGGCDAYLSKPARPREILEMVAGMLGQQ